MPAAMEDWRSPGVSREESAGTGSGAEMGGGARGHDSALMPVASKRQRRPSVRLGEIGDLKVAVSKSEGLSTVRWISPNFIPRKSQSGLVRAGGKLPRTRPLANVTHRGEIGKVLGSPKVGSNDDVVVAVNEVKGEDAEKEELEVPEPPSTSGRGSHATVTPGYGNRKGRPAKRKRAANIRSSTIAKTIGVVTLNRKAKELQKVGYVGSLAPAVSNVDASGVPMEFAELSGTQADMEEDSGAARATGNDDVNGEDHTQNGDTEVLEDDGNGENSSGRQEEDEPVSPRVRDNHIISTNGALERPDGFTAPKDDRDQCTSRLTDGEKDRKNALLLRDASMNGRRGESLLLREASMNGRRGEARGVRGWLSSLGLDKYADLFEENEVDNEVLHLLTFEDLKEMGILAVGARRKMFAAIQELGMTTFPGR